MKWFANSCQRHRESLCLLAGGLLAGEEAADIENHLIECAGCRRHYDELKKLTEPLAGWEKHFNQVDPSAAARLRWERAVAMTGRPESVRMLAPGRVLLECWQQLIRPARHIWSGLAVIWLFILAANLNFRAGTPPLAATASSRPADFVRLLLDQQQMMAELNGQPEIKVAEPPKPAKPSVTQPRSERHGTTFVI
jgi:hypothetical protein